MIKLKKSVNLPIDKKLVLFWVLVVALIGLVFFALWSYQPTNTVFSAYQINPKSIDGIGSNEYRLLAEYCKGVNNNVLGLIVRSDVEFVPVPVNQDSKNGCESYGAKIHAKSETEIKVRIFQQSDLFNLKKELENNRARLNYQWLSAQQNLIKEFSSPTPNYEKIVSLNSEIQYIQSLLESNKSSLKSLISLK